MRRLGRRRFVLVVLALWVGGLALTLAPSLPMIIAGLAIVAGAGFLCQSSSTSYVAITAKDGASTAVGLYVTFFYVGGSVGATLGGVGWNLRAGRRSSPWRPRCWASWPSSSGAGGRAPERRAE